MTDAAEIAGRPKRVQLRRTKDWRMPENTVKVDRRTRWGNPFNLKASEHCWTAISFGHKGDPAGRHAASVDIFRLWIAGGRSGVVTGCGLYAEKDGVQVAFAESPTIEAPTPPSTEEIVRELHGKNLACWCPPDKPCHADVLLELANSEPRHAQ